jgi:hypothetical protein
MAKCSLIPPGFCAILAIRSKFSEFSDWWAWID